MSTCPRCYNVSCPAPVTEVTITETTMSLETERYVNAGVSGSVVTLPYTPYSGFPIQVYVNGVLQRETAHYTVADTVITFVNPLVSDDVVVVYVRAS